MKKVINSENACLIVLFGFVLSCALAFSGCTKPESKVNTIPKDSHYPMEMHDLIYPTTDYDIEALANRIPPARPHYQSKPFGSNDSPCGCCGYTPWTDSWCEIHRNPDFPATIFFPNRYKFTGEELHSMESDLQELMRLNRESQY